VLANYILDDIVSSNELTIHEHLGESRPLAEEFYPLSDLCIGQHVNCFVFDSEVIQKLTYFYTVFIFCGGVAPFYEYN